MDITTRPGRSTPRLTLHSDTANQIRRSAVLLLFLGALFAVPIVGKTFSAHGAIPAILTGLFVVFAVLAGPVSFLFASVITGNMAFPIVAASSSQLILLALLSTALVFFWLRRARAPGQRSIPYLPVTGWALTGILCCLVQVLAHIA